MHPIKKSKADKKNPRTRFLRDPREVHRYRKALPEYLTERYERADEKSTENASKSLTKISSSLRALWWFLGLATVYI